MLEQLFPKYHRRYAASPHAKELRAFAHWLDEVGYGRDPAHDHVRRLREALDRRRWRLDAPIDRAGVDGLFAELPDDASLSGILCLGHSMTTRSMYATQDEDSGCGRDGVAVDSEGID